MNPLKEKINIDVKAALKSGDALARSVLGMLKAAIANKEIEKRKKEEGLNEAETQEVIRSEVKKRMDAVMAFRSAGDEVRAQSETGEAEILKKYLPPQASDEDIKTAVEKAVTQAGSRSKKDFGKIMGLAVKELAGRADGHRVKAVLESMLE
ncbi:MAG: GatB/YqeY domain-containing protein [Candidatus Sungbacteria bacterium]|uniref:GatB/YqeY domain-containing protein n=1 Tax=Candidatus Sungiibacteriota bacterium TaxID=2750080 RepID=A0A931YDL6_9BACT|nr:GatB/YqeY domain-containing protein [Candidatus Sungbacteria bacterium]MBI2465948.1 GatB/YqeY domain-containing protein [Candidatus Sungbacteria bacterium]